MKTLSISEACKAGFVVVNYGSRYFIPVALPREVAMQDFQSVIAEQFDPRFEGEGDEGYFVQAIEDVRGQFGLRGTIYIVRAHYSHNDGVQDWTAYGAVEVKR